MSTAKTKIVIDRSKWRTGARNRNVATGHGDTLLRNDEGYMCCLGFICRAAGIPDNKLNIGEPGDIYIHDSYSQRIEVPDIAVCTDGRYGQTDYADAAIMINDNEEYSLQEKEARLQKVFAPSCYELEFVGEPTPYCDPDD